MNVSVVTIRDEQRSYRDIGIGDSSRTLIHSVCQCPFERRALAPISSNIIHIQAEMVT